MNSRKMKFAIDAPIKFNGQRSKETEDRDMLGMLLRRLKPSRGTLEDIAALIGSMLEQKEMK